MPDTNLTSKSASATMHTYLMVNKNGWQKVIDIKDYPAMGGSPEQIETTTLSNEKSTFVTGVQSMPTFEFLANYTMDDYDRLEGLKDVVYEYALAFGKPTGDTTTSMSYGSLGSFTWKGQLNHWIEGGGVNAAREERISISVTEEVKFSKSPIVVTQTAE